MASTMKPVWLCAVATAAMVPALAQAQTPAQTQPVKPVPSQAPANPITGGVSQSDPTDPGSQPPPPGGTLGNNAPAPETATQDADDATSATDIVVTGFRSSLQAGLDLKREAITIRDSIVAEDIGRFPENNIAESLQRIPGVELIRDGNSNEGQTIQLRGLGSTFTVTTFNGSPVYTTSGGGVGNASRNFNYDVFPSELFGRADVYKAPLAELTEGGVAGVVDLNTPRPFDGKGGRKIRYAVQGNWNSQSGDYNPRGNFLISDTAGNFGALIAVAGAKVTNGRAGFNSTGNYSSATASAAQIVAAQRRTPLPGNLIGSNFNYNFNAPGVNLNGNSQQQILDAILPRFFQIGAGRNERERLGAAASLQYKTDRIDISLDGLYSVVTDDNQNADIRFPIRDSVNGAVPNATNQLALVPLNVRVDENSNLQGTLGNVQFFYNSGFDQSETKYKYLALNGSYKVTDTLRVAAQVAISDSRAFRNNIGLSGDARQLRHELTFDTTNPVFPTISTNRDLLERSNYFTNAGPAYGGGYREEEDRLKSGRLVVDWDYKLFEVEGHLKAGIAYNRNVKTLLNLATNNLYNTLTIPGVGLYSAPTTTLAQRNTYITSFLERFSTRDFVPGAPSSFPDVFLAFPREFAYGTLNAVAVNKVAPANLGSTYEAAETIKAAFIQSDFSGDLFGRRLRVNGGVRFVETGSDVDNFVLVQGAFVPNTRSGKYRNFLPSVTMAYDLTDQIVLRAAAGKTFSRAAIQSIAASISLPAGGAGVLALNAGNPDLRPEYSTSLDGSAEWYFAPGGVLSVAAYRKKISGRAVTLTRQIPFDQLGIPSSIFTLNISQDLTANPQTLIDVRTPQNLDEYSISGLEFAYQQQFRFLPEPFDGLGAVASFTKVNTQGLVRDYILPAFGAITTPAPGFPAQAAVNLGSLSLDEVPATTYQMTGYYEKGPFSFRVSYNWKDEVANVGQNSTQPIGLQRYANPRGYLDLTTSYKFAKWLEFRLDVINLTKTITYDFFRDVQGRFGDENSRVEGATQNGRTIQFGIRGSF